MTKFVYRTLSAVLFLQSQFQVVTAEKMIDNPLDQVNQSLDKNQSLTGNGSKENLQV